MGDFDTMRINELILYKHMEQEKILKDMTFLMENYNNTYYNNCLYIIT